MSVNKSLYIYNFNYGVQAGEDPMEVDNKAAAILCELRKSQDVWTQTPLSNTTNKVEPFPLAAPKTNEFKRSKNDEENGADLYLKHIFYSRQPRASRQITDRNLKMVMQTENEKI